MGKAITEPGVSAFRQTYEHDGVNRLILATEGTAWGRGWGYDQYGNGWVSAYAGIAPITNLTPTALTDFNPANNRIVKAGFSYDPAGSGNLQSANGVAYTYDAENRLTKSETTILGSPNVVVYAYDDDGRRVKKTVNSATPTVYVYDASGNLAAEYDGTTPAAYVPSYLTADHLGSTRLVTNASGGVISRHDYLPFGEEIAADKGPRPQILGYANAYTDGITQKFTGKERDTDTIVNVLDYFGARYFSSNMGRWTTPDKPLADQDPDDRQSWNMYGYVRDNPLRHIDPDGEGAWDLMKGFAEGSYNFARHAVVGTVAALATVMSAPTAQAGMAEVLVPPVVNAVDDYRAGGVGGRLLAQGEQGAMAVVTEAVLTGGATAYALKDSIESVSDSLAGKGAPVPRVPPGENQAAIAGRTAHADFAQKVKAKPGWQSQPSLTDPATGKTVKPDAVTPTGRPLELKPKTTSGRAAGRRELPKYERATDKKGRVIYYEQK